MRRNQRVGWCLIVLTRFPAVGSDAEIAGENGTRFDFGQSERPSPGGGRRFDSERRRVIAGSAAQRQPPSSIGCGLQQNDVFGLLGREHTEPFLGFVFGRKFPVVFEDHYRGVACFQRHFRHVLSERDPVAAK